MYKNDLKDIFSLCVDSRQWISKKAYTETISTLLYKKSLSILK